MLRLLKIKCQRVLMLHTCFCFYFINNKTTTERFSVNFKYMQIQMNFSVGYEEKNEMIVTYSPKHMV